MGHLCQISLSKGGVPKVAVPEAEVGWLGLVGDRQQHPKIHGGPDRALCLFSRELITKLQGEGHPICPGSTGENLTLAGLEWTQLSRGTRLQLGQVILELTWVAEPCKQIAASFLDRRFQRLAQQGEMRWYCRVLQPGAVRVEMPVRVS